jgi:hypothetical protein
VVPLWARLAIPAEATNLNLQKLKWTALERVELVPSAVPKKCLAVALRAGAELTTTVVVFSLEVFFRHLPERSWASRSSLAS